jgi:hypothetical protein
MEKWFFNTDQENIDFKILSVWLIKLLILFKINSLNIIEY